MSFVHDGATARWYSAKAVRPIMAPPSHQAPWCRAVIASQSSPGLAENVIGLILGLPGPDGAVLLIGGDPGMPDGYPATARLLPLERLKENPRSRQRLNLLSHVLLQAC